VVFRSRLRRKHLADFERHAEEMLAIARSMPGFISYKRYVADDGERISLHEWESAEALRAWRDHPRHREVQTRVRSHYYAEYTSYVCDSPREWRFEHRSGDTSA
jgi:heme-degrading monooxygenase HmoA